MISFLQCIIFERISYSEWPLAAKFRTNYLIQAVINDYLYRNFFPLIVSSLSKTKLMYEGQYVCTNTQVCVVSFQRNHNNVLTKGHLISKAIYGLLTSPQKRTDEFVLFAFLFFTANKSNSSIRFLGKSMARQSAFGFYLTFKSLLS